MSLAPADRVEVSVAALVMVALAVDTRLFIREPVLRHWMFSSLLAVGAVVPAVRAMQVRSSEGAGQLRAQQRAAMVRATTLARVLTALVAEVRAGRLGQLGSPVGLVELGVILTEVTADRDTGAAVKPGRIAAAAVPEAPLLRLRTKWVQPRSVQGAAQGELRAQC